MPKPVAVFAGIKTIDEMLRYLERAKKALGGEAPVLGSDHDGEYRISLSVMDDTTLHIIAPNRNPA